MPYLFSDAERSQMRALGRKAFPVCLGILLAVLLNLADMWYIAMLGADPLAAISFTFPVMLGLSHGLIGLGTGITTVIARRAGAEAMRDAYGAAVLLPATAAIIGVTLAVLCLIIYVPAFEALGAQALHMPYLRDYMPVWLGVCFPALALLTGCNAALRGFGDTVTPSKALAIAALLNGALDPLLIFGLGPVPAMEVFGAALATAIAVVAAAGFSAAQLWRRIDSRAVMLKIAEARALIRAMLFIGFPAIIAQLAPATAQLYITAMAAGFGPDYVAGYGVGTRIETVFLVVFMGMAGATNIFASTYAGAGDGDALKILRRALMKSCIAIGAVLTGLLWFSAVYIVPVVAPTAAVAQATFVYIYAAPLSMGAAGACMAASACLNGMMRPYAALSVYALRCVIFLVPAGMALSLIGVKGLYQATNIANIAAFAYCVLLLPRYERMLFSTAK